MTALADWRHRLNEIPAGGLRTSRSATPAERAEVARQLPLVSCEALTVQYHIKHAGRDRYSLTGRVIAEVTQSCIVTLDPVNARIDEQLDCKFVPPAAIPKEQTEEEELSSIDELEPIEGGFLNVGQVVFEVISAGLDPYPRRPDAEWENNSDAASGEGADPGPFSALAGLKRNT